MRFVTKVDLWIILLLTLIPAGAIVAILIDGKPWVLAVVVPFWALISLIVWPCDYTLQDDHLVVRSGFIKWRVPYSEIQKVYPTRNPLSSPAWSLDRIAIAYGKRFVMVSPKDKEGFLRGLMAKAGLKATPEGLAR